MKKALAAALACLMLLAGCSAGKASVPPSLAPAESSVHSADATPAEAASASPAAPEPSAVSTVKPGSPGRTPDPASELLVTGTVTAVPDGSSIQVHDDSLNKDMVVTMLNRAQYADGVSRQFKVGNHVRVITSNKLAKTLPERAAAVLVIENK